MDSQKAMDQYFENSVRTASPEQLTLMLYNGCIRNMRTGIRSLGEKDLESAGRALIKAQRIVCELRDTLDYRYEVSRQLGPLYDFMNTTLIEANIHKDCGRIESVCRLMTELRDAWYQAMSQKGHGAEAAALRA